MRPRYRSWARPPRSRGTFRPEGALAALNGKSANGTWRLRITDDLGGDVGNLLCWSVTITG